MSRTLVHDGYVDVEEAFRLDVRIGPAPMEEGRARGDLRLAYWLSGGLAAVTLVAAAVGVFVPAIFRDPPGTAGSWQGTDLVILAVALPSLVASMTLTARGFVRARVVWLGSLGYLVYFGAAYAFAAAFNPLFPLYVAGLSLAFWSLMVLVSRTDAAGVCARFAPRVARAFAVWIVFTAALSVLKDVSEIATAIAGNTVPVGVAEAHWPINPFQVLNEAFLLPIQVLAAVWLWRGRPWGALLGGALLVYGVLATAGVASDQWFMALRDPSLAPDAVPLFSALSLIGLAVLVAFLRQVRTDTSTGSP